MGYCFGVGICFMCCQTFSFNPNYVPSIRQHGDKKPVCGQCMEMINNKRVEFGLEPHVIHPEAYDVLDEREL